MDFPIYKAIHISLPGQFIPEIKNKKVYLIIEELKSISILTAIKTALEDEDEERVDIPFPIEDFTGCGRFIEEASKRLFDRHANESNPV